MTKGMLLVGMNCSKCGLYMLGSFKDKNTTDKICSECAKKLKLGD